MDKYPLCEFKLKGKTFQAFTAPDDFGHTPWERDDGHGPVRWVRDAREEKRPGERILWQERDGGYLYDFAAAVKFARKDGWSAADLSDAGPYATREDQATAKELGITVTTLRAERAAKDGTPGERAAKAAEADFQFLHGFCRGDWCYVGVIVEGAGERESLWGIESDAEDYLKETARDLANEILDRVAEKRRLAELRHCLVGSAPCA